MRVDSQSRQKDWEFALQVSREARRDPTSPYAHKYVGILGGQVVVIADTVEEAVQKLRQLEPDPRRGLLIDASADNESVEYVWGF